LAGHVLDVVEKGTLQRRAMKLCAPKDAKWEATCYRLLGVCKEFLRLVQVGNSGVIVMDYLAGDEHTITLYTYFVIFNDFQYLCDLWQHYTTQMMCFKPLAIYVMSFQPFLMIYNVFIEFPMFARSYLTYYYIDGLSMHSPYYSILI
jgi:hypothetical protein